MNSGYNRPRRGEVRQYRPVDPDSLTPERLAGIIDYTLLRPEVSVVDYRRFLDRAARWGFHSVFLPPYLVPEAVRRLSGTNVIVGTPVSFPFGYGHPEVKAAEAVNALDYGARELDVVMNISAARSGDWELVSEDLDEVTTTVRAWEKANSEGPVVLKLILETPYLNEAEKSEACRRAAAAGMDFVKTATGLGPGGATESDIVLMRRVVGDRLGVKAAGGVRTWSEARAMIAAGAVRIGTSTGPGLVEDFLRVKGAEPE